MRGTNEGRLLYTKRERATQRWERGIPTLPFFDFRRWIIREHLEVIASLNALSNFAAVEPRIVKYNYWNGGVRAMRSEARRDQ
ncbi:MAG: hypothetical protein HY286_06505 [Planctomycetes bacterium]|nr:hypothetical protein [Planctomycetota bacterium]